MSASDQLGRQTRSPAVRRNGSLQSCEPCRKSKQRCDHGRPVCARCTTKKIAARCFYHPAPMTKQAAARRAAFPPQSQGLAQHSSTTAQPPHAPIESPAAYPGYLGSTSYTAILAEYRTELALEAEDSTVSDPFARSIDPGRLQSGLKLLKLLHNLRICDNLLRRYYSRVLVAVIPEVIVTSIMRSIRDILDNLDTGQDMEGQLEDLVGKISQNTSRPLSTRGLMTVEQYCATFTGGNLRWEAIGIVFATSGISLMSTPDSDPDLNQVATDNQTRDRLRAQLVEASGTCLSLCDQASSVNELLGFCQYNDMALLTHHYGDSCYQSWRRLGDLSATIYAAGLHQEISQPDDCPFFLRQWRRMCFAAAFAADKNVATFVGRPPYINHRYCTLAPPLDVSEPRLVVGGDALDQSVSELDNSGWAITGDINRVSVLRLRFIFAVFREQALEIALGTSENWDLVQKSTQIIEKARETWEACPARLRYDAPGQKHAEPSPLSFTTLHIYLDYLYTIFLLRRTVVKRTDTEKEALFDTSRLILSIVIKANGDQDSVLDLRRHHAWVLLYYGLPSASVLTLELLHQNQGIGTYSTVLPRAETIRNLSVFVSCLSWVARPGHGNYHTCKAVEKKLSHILDQILDPQPMAGDLFNDATSGLSSFLDWSNPNGWDFTSEYLDAFTL
ncbi:putative C6 transcription factor [Aspergillus heteromorphus CBS 117.55]|uniref:Putative C6 transcription factor n=1 Tax=Aspergillus heteromorphus CBS 117.55 TaxID=1448321 RepID=A0A317WV13_9EURO|nr:putative C6 transcription factor [Aspergillus heteromorphus CBS 117.55]PWY90199.1 putative C6 transcription factor [Aspergillus heteromorphus CBS 117.55]